jgi:adenylate cyclase
VPNDEKAAGLIATASRAAKAWRRWPRVALAGRVRLATGLWLFLFAATHLANHALGLVSVRAMEAGRDLFVAFWRSWPAEAALVVAFLTHAAFGLQRVAEQRSFRQRWLPTVQLGLGLAIPLYLVGHVMATAWLHRCCGVTDSYAFYLSSAWPGAALNPIPFS